jgi:hypothetical protein
MPEQCARVILHLSDGTQVQGIWTGQKWWAERREVEPVRWEYPQSVFRRQRKVARNGLEKLAKRVKKASASIAESMAEGAS